MSVIAKKICMQARHWPKHFDKLNPGPTYNAAAANQKLSTTERSFEN